MRDCLARAVLHGNQKTASNWRVCMVQPDQDAVGQAATAGLGVPLSTEVVRKSTAKDAANCWSLTSLCAFQNEIVGLLEGPTSAPSAPPQYEGAPNLATGELTEKCTGFLHRVFIAFSKSRIALGDSRIGRCEKAVRQGRKRRPVAIGMVRPPTRTSVMRPLSRIAET